MRKLKKKKKKKRSLRYYNDGGESTMGYREDSPYKNEPQILVDSNNITMDKVKKKLMLIPVDENGKKGKPVLARPGDQNHYFPDYSHVLEVPIAKEGKDVHDKPGGSNVGKKTFSNGEPRTGPYAGPSGGAPAGSYPIPDINHAKAAIALSGHAPNPEGIKAAVYRKYPQLKKEDGGDIPEMKKGGKWIQSAHLNKGRCTPGSPNYDCPKGSPQWNLAQTFKKHHGFHKKEYGGDISPEKALEMLHNPPHGIPLSEKQRKFFGYLSNRQEGGPAMATNYPVGFNPQTMTQYLPQGQMPLSNEQLQAMGYIQPPDISQYLTPTGDYRAYKTVTPNTPAWNTPANPYYIPPVPRQSVPSGSQTSGMGTPPGPTNRPTVPISQRRGIQKLGLNIHTPGVNRFGFKYGGTPEYHEGGEHCIECQDKQDSMSFEKDNIFAEKKNDFVDWLKNKSMHVVKNELDNEAGYHQMPDGSVMLNSEMKYGGGINKYFKKDKKGKNIPKLSSYCGGPVNEACITAAINDPDPRVRQMAAFTKRIRGYKFQDGGQPCSEEDKMIPGSPCYNQNQETAANIFNQGPDYNFLQDIQDQQTGPFASQDPNGQYPYTQGDQNRIKTLSQSLPTYMVNNQSNRSAMQTGLDVTKNIANPGMPEFLNQPQSNTTSRGPNPMAANAMLFGMDALTNFFGQDERKKREEQLRNKTHADQLFTPVEGSRGDYSVNEGYFQPDQMNPGMYKAGGQYYMSDSDVKRLRSQGYDIEEID